MLGFLSIKERTGYDLKHDMDQGTSRLFWNAKQSQIYTTLKRIEQENLVESIIEPQKDRPDRRVYKITEKGRNNLIEWLKQPNMSLAQVKNPFLLKLFFSAPLDKADILTHLRLQRDLRTQQLNSIRSMLKEPSKEFYSENLTGDIKKRWEIFEKSVQILGEKTVKLEIEWLEETINQIEENL
ncbi:MAG: PadR family transcriptional regulator [Candidatus Hodarchaeales archaeon]